VLATACFVFQITALAKAQQDPFRNFEGTWVAVNPPGAAWTFFQSGLGTWEVTAPFGRARISVSDGRDGSNLKVAGPGIECYYTYRRIDAKEMVWEYKSGHGDCPRSADIKKDPP
jgi:hypothetical protein